MTRQYLLARLGDERALLDSVARELTCAGYARQLQWEELRRAAARIEISVSPARLGGRTSAASGHALMSHGGFGATQAIHIAKWRWLTELDSLRRVTNSRNARFAASSGGFCETHRSGDVSGYEIPSRYFRSCGPETRRRSNESSSTIELDLLTLANLTARAINLVASGVGTGEAPTRSSRARPDLLVRWISRPVRALLINMPSSCRAPRCHPRFTSKP